MKKLLIIAIILFVLTGCAEGSSANVTKDDSSNDNSSIVNNNNTTNNVTNNTVNNTTNNNVSGNVKDINNNTNTAQTNGKTNTKESTNTTPKRTIADDFNDVYKVAKDGLYGPEYYIDNLIYHNWSRKEAEEYVYHTCNIDWKGECKKAFKDKLNNTIGFWNKDFFRSDLKTNYHYTDTEIDYAFQYETDAWNSYLKRIGQSYIDKGSNISPKWISRDMSQKGASESDIATAISDIDFVAVCARDIAEQAKNPAMSKDACISWERNNQGFDDDIINAALAICGVEWDDGCQAVFNEGYRKGMDMYVEYNSNGQGKTHDGWAGWMCADLGYTLDVYYVQNAVFNCWYRGYTDEQIIKAMQNCDYSSEYLDPSYLELYRSNYD